MNTADLDARNEYGFPVAIGTQARMARATQYAAEARERNRPPCSCETCRREALLPAVQRLTANWKTAEIDNARHAIRFLDRELATLESDRRQL